MLAKFEGEEMFRALTETTSAAICIIQDGRFQFVNRAMVAISGRSEAELLSCDFLDLVHPDSLAPVGRQYADWLSGVSGEFQFEFKGLSKHGKPGWIEISARAIEYRGRPALLMTGIDITERKRTGEALQESEARFNEVLRNLTDSFIIFDSRWRFVYVNDVASKRFGLPGDRLIGQVVWDLWPQSVGSVQYKVQRKTMDDKIPRSWIDRSPSTGLWYEYRVFPWRDGIASFSRDITKRMLAEDALKLDEARLETLIRLNNMADATDDELFSFALENAMKITGSNAGIIGTFSPDESTVYINAVTRNLIQRHVTGGFYIDLNGPGRLTDLFRGHQPLMVNTLDPSHLNSLPPGHIPVTRLLKVPVIEDGHAVAFCMVANKETGYTDADIRQMTLLTNGLWRIYARRVAEDSVLMAKAQAELYLDLMGHDINNMHQIALGYLEMALEKYPDDDILLKPTEVLRRSARLIRNVRKLQNLNEGKYQTREIDLCRLLADLQSDMGSKTNKRVTLNLNGCEQCLVRANELLGDVFENLASNAIKHTGDSEEIVIGLNVRENNQVRYYRVTVDDDGPGIHDKFKGVVFNRALKGTAMAKGIGLGLYLVKTVVESYDGKVWVVDRVPGDHTKGARFIVMLPAAEK